MIDQLRTLVEDGYSIREIAKRLDCSPTNIRYWARKNGLRFQRKKPRKEQTDKFCAQCGKPLLNRNSTYCSQLCHVNATYDAYILRWKNGEEEGTKGTNKEVSSPIRKYLFIKYKHRCSKCGWMVTHPQTGKVPLQVHHKDGNFKNNKEDNLDLLCPNCHSLTETFGGLNKGKDKMGRRKSGCM